MKKFILFILLLSFSVAGCSTKPKDEPAIADTKPTIELNGGKNEFVVSENISVDIKNDDINNYTIDVSDSDFADIDGSNVRFRKQGTYSIIAFNNVTTSIILQKEITVYGRDFSLKTTTNVLSVGEKTIIDGYKFDDLKEQSISDFNFIYDSELVEMQGNILTAKKNGNAEIKAVSKYNDNVEATLSITISDTALAFKPENEFGVIKVGEESNITLANYNGNLEDYQFSTTDSEVARINYNYADLKILGVGEGTCNIICVNKKDPTIKATYTITVTGEEDTDYIYRFVMTAFKEVGTYEGRDDTGWNNDTKYGKWYGNNGQPWCATFVSWSWYFSGLSQDIFLKYQGCATGKEWAEDKGIFHYKENYSPVSGDIVFFLSNGMSHTGLVAYSDDTYIYTIEGNNSQKVGIWRWQKTNTKITGYAHPKFPSELENDLSWIATKKENGKYLWTDYSSGNSVT